MTISFLLLIVSVSAAIVAFLSEWWAQPNSRERTWGLPLKLSLWALLLTGIATVGQFAVAEYQRVGAEQDARESRIQREQLRQAYSDTDDHLKSLTARLDSLAGRLEPGAYMKLRREADQLRERMRAFEEALESGGQNQQRLNEELLGQRHRINELTKQVSDTIENTTRRPSEANPDVLSPSGSSRNETETVLAAESPSAPQVEAPPASAIPREKTRSSDVIVGIQSKRNEPAPDTTRPATPYGLTIITSQTGQRQPSKVQQAAGFSGRTPSVAVLAFKNSTPWWGRMLGASAADQLTMKLVQSGAFKVLDRERVRAILDEWYLTQANTVDLIQATQLGQSVGVSYLLIGELEAFEIKTLRLPITPVVRMTASSSIKIRAIGVAAGAIVAAAQVKRDGVLGQAPGTNREIPTTGSWSPALAEEALREPIDSLVAQLVAQQNSP